MQRKGETEETTLLLAISRSRQRLILPCCVTHSRWRSPGRGWWIWKRSGRRRRGVRVSLRLSLLQPFRLVSVSSQKEVLCSSLDGKGRGGEKSVLSTGFLSSAEPFPLFSASAASAVRRRPPAPSFLQLFCFGWTVSLLFSSPLGLLVFPVVAAAFAKPR